MARPFTDGSMDEFWVTIQSSRHQLRDLKADTRLADYDLKRLFRLDVRQTIWVHACHDATPILTREPMPHTARTRHVHAPMGRCPLALLPRWAGPGAL